MNVLEAKQFILSVLIQKDSLTIKECLSNFGKNQNKETEAAIRSALAELEQLKIINKVELSNSENNETIWILNKPLFSYEQNVMIDGLTAKKISLIVNNFLKTTGQTDVQSNPLNICKEDILILLDIIDLYAQSNIIERKKK